MLTTKDRDRLRRKQDKLIALATSTGEMHLPICDQPGAPIGSELIPVIYPVWELEIDGAIRRLDPSESR